jgi:hypothetical protein
VRTILGDDLAFLTSGTCQGVGTCSDGFMRRMGLGRTSFCLAHFAALLRLFIRISLIPSSTEQIHGSGLIGNVYNLIQSDIL